MINANFYLQDFCRQSMLLQSDFRVNRGPLRIQIVIQSCSWLQRTVPKAKEWKSKEHHHCSDTIGRWRRYRTAHNNENVSCQTTWKPLIQLRSVVMMTYSWAHSIHHWLHCFLASFVFQRALHPWSAYSLRVVSLCDHIGQRCPTLCSRR